MKETKLKVWNKATKKMYEVIRIDFYDEKVGYLFADPIVQCESINYLNFSDVELMQSTGLKDKNGKEIYEGDICRWRDLETFNDEILEDIFVVVWNDEKLAWYTQNEDGNFGYDLYEYTDDRDLGVIGNIYENIDLLEVKKMKVRRFYELLNGYSTSLNDEILFYDSNGNELELADIDGDDGEISIIFEQKTSIAEVEE